METVARKKYKKKWAAENRVSNCKACKKWGEKNPGYERPRRDPAYRKQYAKEHPWLASYRCAYGRCKYPNHQSYKNYGGKGIKFKMTIEEIKYLWFRDQADMMKRPSIDRKDSTGHYEISNCRFLELTTNIKRKKETT